MARVVL